MLRQQNTLKRLATLYEVILESELAEMRHKRALLDEVERAIVGEEATVWSAQQYGSNALRESDLLGWKQAHVEAALVAWNHDRLRALREERHESCEAAHKRYRTTQIMSGQLEQLLEDSTRKSEEAQERLMQTLSDERHLSRQRWKEMQRRRLSDKTRL